MDGSDLVLMADGTRKEVSLVVKGDRVYGGRVVAKIEFISSQGTLSMVKIPFGPTLLPWHPVCIGDKWMHALHVEPARDVQCSSVFSFILDFGHIMNVGGYDCVTWGHMYKGPVLSHSYFGTKRVIEDMSRMIGYQDGHVVLVDAQVIRENGQVLKIY